MTSPETQQNSGSPTPVASTSRRDQADLVDVVAAAVRAVPGVADLHAGVFGEVGTYLPGRRVAGISIGADGTAVHVALLMGHPVRETAAQVRAAVAPLTRGAVHVTVEDVVAGPGPDPDPVPGSAATPDAAGAPATGRVPGAADTPGAPGDRA